MPRGCPVCIYHFPCADGFTAAWGVWKRFGEGFEYIPMNYGEPIPEGLDGRDVYLVDFSFKRPVLKELAAKANFVVIIDHHKTAVEDLAGLEDELENVHVVFDMERSGAMMAWNYFHGYEDVPKLVEYVQDRDLWLKKLPFCDEAAAYVFAHDYRFEVWDGLRDDFENKFSNVMTGGSFILKKQRKDIQELLKASTRYGVIGGVEVLIANLPYTMSSEGASILAIGTPFGACYFDKKDHRMWSLRSAEDGADVSAIAAQYGGGGHKHAAGFQSALDWCGDE